MELQPFTRLATSSRLTLLCSRALSSAGWTTLWISLVAEALSFLDRSSFSVGAAAPAPIHRQLLLPEELTLTASLRWNLICSSGSYLLVGRQHTLTRLRASSFPTRSSFLVWASSRGYTPATPCLLMSWLITALLAVGPDLLVGLVLINVDGDPLVAVFGDLLLQRVL